jgi:helix-turn-helix protein
VPEEELALRTARQLWTIFEPLHAVTYFAPEGRAAFEAAGLRGFWRGYFASRSAPLGLAPAAVTTALYANFAPRMVERAIPSVWELATPSAALGARLAGSVAALDRLLAGADVAEAASLLQEVAAVAPTSGRALGAANAALPWPTEPLAVLWQAATVLRELRGDGHVLAQLAVGLDGLSTMVLRCGHDLVRAALQPNRGWTDEEWEGCAAGPTSRGLLGTDRQITPAGLALLDRVESLTDELAQEPWTMAGPDVVARFTELAAPLARSARTALPPVNPIGLPST